MAKFNILSINKMTAGERRGLIDMTISLSYDLANAIVLDGILSSNETIEDVAISVESGNPQHARTEYVSDFDPARAKNPLAMEDLSTSILLSEDQKYFLSGSADYSSPQCIQLTPQSWLDAAASSQSTLIAQMTSAHVIYEYENVHSDNTKTLLQQSNSPNAVLMPLNDLLDLCIKSQFKKSSLNSNVPGDLVSKTRMPQANWNIDIYLDFKSYPIEFCQCNSGGFMLTQPTTLQPYTLHAKFSSDSTKELHSFQLLQKTIKTKLYAQPQDITPGANTYQQALSAHGSWYSSNEHTLEIFDDKATNLLGVQYSYVVGVDQAKSQNSSDNPTIYCNGDIYGSMSMTKSMYSPLYSTEVSADQQHQELCQCRTYCGIQNSQNKLLLKYYDDISYTFSRNAGDVEVQTHTLHKDGQRKYPYQKVEYFLPNKAGTQARHKSNLFSIKVNKSGLDDTSLQRSGASKALAEQIKRDLFNGMKQLADSIAPANTQLFKAYYIDK